MRAGKGNGRKGTGIRARPRSKTGRAPDQDPGGQEMKAWNVLLVVLVLVGLAVAGWYV